MTTVGEGGLVSQVVCMRPGKEQLERETMMKGLKTRNLACQPEP